jgi:hypothetical protein
MISSSLNLSEVKSLLAYFGYEYGKNKNGTWEFRHKVFAGNHCYITPRFGGSFIARVEFWFEGGNKMIKQDIAMPKSWKGLFIAIRTHTKSLIFRREVINQQLKQAA